MDDEIDQLELELAELDAKIAKMRHELIWRKREIRPGFEPEGIVELEAEYLALSDQFTVTWSRWNRAHAAQR